MNQRSPPPPPPPHQPSRGSSEEDEEDDRPADYGRSPSENRAQSTYGYYNNEDYSNGNENSNNNDNYNESNNFNHDSRNYANDGPEEGFRNNRNRRRPLSNNILPRNQHPHHHH